jgi:hypothetical protein
MHSRGFTSTLNSQDLAACDTISLAIDAIPEATRCVNRRLLLLLPTIPIAQGTITVGGGAGSSNRVGPTPTQPAAPPQPTNPEDLCSVEGKVVDTGEPVRDVEAVTPAGSLRRGSGGRVFR